MGCWNHTCAVTNLPIYDGEAVEVILLKSSSVAPDSESFCYAGSYHQPIPLTFHGTYNDYGAVENCEGVALDIIVDKLRDVLTEFEIGENEYHDIAVKKEDFDVNFLFEADHESRLYIKNELRSFANEAENIRVKHIVVRKNVYDAIVERTVIDWWYGSASHTLASLDYDAFAKSVDTYNKLDKGSVEWALATMGSKHGSDVISQMLSYDGGGVYGMDRPINVTEVLQDTRLEHPEIFDDLVDNAMRFAMFNHFMEDGRKSWVVPTGVGSQNGNTKSQELCAELTLSEAEKLSHLFDEEE